MNPGRGGFFHGEDQAFIEAGLLQPANLVAGIEHAATLALLDADGSREGAVGQLLLAPCREGQNRARNRRRRSLVDVLVRLRQVVRMSMRSPQGSVQRSSGTGP